MYGVLGGNPFVLTVVRYVPAPRPVRRWERFSCLSLAPRLRRGLGKVDFHGILSAVCSVFKVMLAVIAVLYMPYR